MHCAVIDPAVATAELECFNQLVHHSPIKLSYHLPALFGMNSLKRVSADLSSIIILGSRSSVHDKLPWQDELADWISPHLRKGVPTLGICFGHQFLAHLYGAKVEYLHKDKRKAQGFRKVSFKGSRLWPDGQGELFGSHCEKVSNVPTGFRQIATCEVAQVEGLEHESLPIFSLQSHPEAVGGFLGNDQNASRFAYGHLLMKTFLSRKA